MKKKDLFIVVFFTSLYILFISSPVSYASFKDAFVYEIYYSYKLEEQNEYIQKELDSMIVEYGLEDLTKTYVYNIDTLYTEEEINLLLESFDDDLKGISNSSFYLVQMRLLADDYDSATPTYKQSLYTSISNTSYTYAEDQAVVDAAWEEWDAQVLKGGYSESGMSEFNKKYSTPTNFVNGVYVGNDELQYPHLYADEHSDYVENEYVDIGEDEYMDSKSVSYIPYPYGFGVYGDYITIFEIATETTIIENSYPYYNHMSSYYLYTTSY